MKSPFSKAISLILMLSLLFTLPTGIGASDISNGHDHDEIYDYERLEAPPLEMDLYPYPITGFDIFINKDNSVVMSLETVVPVKLLVKYSQPKSESPRSDNSSELLAFDPIDIEGNDFRDITIPINTSNSSIDIQIINDEIEFSTTIKVLNGEILNKINLNSEYFINNINSMALLASVYEVEPNNTSGTANSTVNADDNYGNFSTTADTDDWWKFTLNYRAYVNLFLGSIPTSSDYDLRLYSSSNTTTPIWSGTNLNNANEILLNQNLNSGTYYLKVTRYSGANTSSYYNLRWKINQHWPVLWTTTINSGFQTPSRPTHDGIDINYTFNTPTTETNKCNGGTQCYYANNIAATWDGTVSSVSNPANPSTGYGRVIYINHNVNGVYYQTRYAHLHSIGVSNGATIKAGDVIGVMGNTGGVSGATGTHSHYEVRSCTTSTCSSTTATNPMTHFPGY